MEQMGAFRRSWLITKLTFSVMTKDKEMLLFPVMSGIFSVLFFIAMLFPAGIIALISGTATLQGYEWIFLFLLYVGLAFISVFFNVCIVHTAKKRFEGKNATFMDSFRFALSRSWTIFLWALTSALVGMILRALEKIAERLGIVGEIIMRILIGIAGASWAIATVFVVPGMVYNNYRPFEAVKMSVDALSRTWGESLIRYFGLGIAEMLFFGIGLAAGALFAILGMASGSVSLLIILLAIVAAYLIGVVIVFNVANTVFSTALYVYATKEDLPDGYSAEIFAHAFKRKTRHQTQ